MLILALAFLGMFAFLAAAVLSFASGVQVQRSGTEKTASIDAVTEGSAQFAISDTGVQGCGTVSSGTMNFASGDKLTYTAGVGACTSSSSSSPGQDCGLCVLDFEGVATPLSVQKGKWTVPSEIDVNGSINVLAISSGVRIGLFGSGATCSTACLPLPLTSLSSKVVDPLAGALPIPTAAASPPSASGNTIICPGTYKDLKATGNGQILFLSPWGQHGCATSTNPSLYIVTGSMSIQGGGSIVASASTIYMTSAASLSTSGGGDFSIDCGATPTSTTCPLNQANTPATGPYAGVAVFADPGNNSVLSLQGNGNFTVAGTFEASHATLSMGGNGGTQSFQTGRLIVSQLQGNGNGGAGLGFSGTVPNATGCNYWTDSLTGTLAAGSSRAGHVRFETACNSGSPSSIISFDYSP